jgi:predicted ester cyclase
MLIITRPAGCLRWDPLLGYLLSQLPPFRHVMQVARHTRAVLERSDTVQRYSEYLDACNRRAWDELGQYVADHVTVKGTVRSRREYVADIVATTAVFPDYRWELRRAVLDGEWLAVHLRDTGTRAGAFLGTPGDGARVETDEFDMYHIIDGLIVEVEGTADSARLSQ